MELQWNFVKAPVMISDIQELEADFCVQLPYSYKKILYNHHGARPDKKRFVTGTGKERVLKSFLPVTKEYKINTYSLTEWLQLPPHLFPFASTPTGDYLCLEYKDSVEPNVILYHHEIDGTEYIAENFSAFLGKLY